MAMKGEREKGSGLTEGVPSAASSLGDGRRVGSGDTLVGIHTVPSLCVFFLSQAHIAALLDSFRLITISPITLCLLPAVPLKVPLSLITVKHNTQQVNSFTFYHQDCLAIYFYNTWHQ